MQIYIHFNGFFKRHFIFPAIFDRKYLSTAITIALNEFADIWNIILDTTIIKIDQIWADLYRL